MAVNNPKLDLIILPTHSPYSIGIGDFSQYPEGFTPSSPTIEITPAGFPTKSLSFVPNNLNVYNSTNLGLTCEEEKELPIPDGIYLLKYSIAPAYENFVERAILRTDLIQEKFDIAFMKLDMVECDRTLKVQQKIDLDTVEYFIECAIAAANQCANEKSIELYNQADKLLNRLIKNYNCG